MWPLMWNIVGWSIACTHSIILAFFQCGNKPNSVIPTFYRNQCSWKLKMHDKHIQPCSSTPNSNPKGRVSTTSLIFFHIGKLIGWNTQEKVTLTYKLDSQEMTHLHFIQSKIKYFCIHGSEFTKDYHRCSASTYAKCKTCTSKCLITWRHVWGLLSVLKNLGHIFVLQGVDNYNLQSKKIAFEVIIQVMKCWTYAICHKRCERLQRSL